ncbi:hypothetical protein [Pararhodobacter sp.]|uniref:hypothetical protein n=1 Tax=Pararhodobacter sp. TaxID=2127056 RepID=UPI002FE0A2EE
MLSLKSLLTASLVALVPPMAASAHAPDPAIARVMPMISALMEAPSARLYRTEYMRTPTLRPTYHLGPSIPHLRLRLRLNCAVAGTPVEFPDDLHIWADFPVAAGTVAHWNVTGTSMQGSVVLPALAAGQYYFAAHALPGGWPAGSACTAYGH